MAVKTITIDLEAYGLLSREKREGQSFSDVIKAHFTPLPSAGRFRRLIQAAKLDRDAVDAIEAVIRARKRNPVRVVKL
jgi:predicted CopG family antitoxin